MEKQEIEEQLNSIWKGWELKDLIGEGSYGKVYKIERDEFGHVYQSALKVMTIPQSSAELRSVINDGMDETSAKEYFYSIVKEIVEEFTLMSRLKGNTNIVSYEDHAVIQVPEGIGWNIYIRMELLTPVLDYFRKSTTSIRDIVKLGIDICQALEICGQYNIIHRDVKPENIFISELGSYKLGDFGSLSRKGTINYMAPEVYKGEKYDQTVDIYSLGLVLYRLLNNNRMPFVPPYPQPILYADKEEANIKRMKGVKLEPPCNAHGRLAELVIKACAFNPADRYQTPSEMKRELKYILSGGKGNAPAYNDDGTIRKIDVDYYPRKEGAADQTETDTYMSTEVSINGTADYGDVSDDINTSDMRRADFAKSVDPDRKRWLIPVISVLVIIAAGVAAFLVYSSSTKSTVPNVAGMTLAEAKEFTSLNEYELVVEQAGEDYSDSVNKGDIISQDIQSGTSVKKGTVIQVVVSKGSQIKVPDLVGHDTTEAENITDSAGLNYSVKDEVYSDDVEAGVVMAQDIEAGTDVDEGQTVSVTVSKGRELISVPSVIGMNVDEAAALLTSLTLSYDISEEYSDDVEADNIIRQDIEEGTMVEKNTKVIISKSLGKKPKVKTTNSSKSSKSSNNSGEVIWKDVD